MLLSQYSLKDIFSILIIGIVIKLMDDYIDTDEISLITKITKQHIGGGAISYILLFFSISCLLNKEISLSLFFGAYIVGMFNDLTRPLLFKLNGFHESLIIFTIGICSFGVILMLTSISIMASIQLFDDIIDKNEDKHSGNKNYAIKYGSVEMCLLAISLTLLSIVLIPNIAILSIVVFIILQFVERKFKRRIINDYFDI